MKLALSCEYVVPGATIAVPLASPLGNLADTIFREQLVQLCLRHRQHFWNCDRDCFPFL
jgi:hypothetical protein